MPSDVMEDYLKAIYQLERAGETPVSTSRIAEYLDVTRPTVSSMIERLTERNLLEREKYTGVCLTDEGETVALEVVRHHRLLEAYLAEQLGYDWSEVHEEADALEHHISETFERRVAQALGDPEVDPHGDPIPSVDLDPLVENENNRLSDYEEGAHVQVTRVRDRDHEDLAYLERAGVTPGTELDIVDIAPFGMVTVRSDSGEQSLPQGIAKSIRVSRIKSTDSPSTEVSGA
ncbi:metal-dependent transcriptional regulator [Halococcus dombrowskii]|uniref:Metal-dependent transcriptional regulator n=1 Tax=Halococcus dombrowskii TaxID=179637 RepID=A0AAV3SL88_HALDO